MSLFVDAPSITGDLPPCSCVLGLDDQCLDRVG